MANVAAEDLPQRHRSVIVERQRGLDGASTAQPVLVVDKRDQSQSVAPGQRQLPVQPNLVCGYRKEGVMGI